MTFALLSSLYIYWFGPTLGKLPRQKFSFPPYFGITRRNLKKKNYFLFVIFLFFLEKKVNFRFDFTTFSANVWSRFGFSSLVALFQKIGKCTMYYVSQRNTFCCSVLSHRVIRHIFLCHWKCCSSVLSTL